MTNSEQPPGNTVLVIDDEPGLREMLKFGLGKLGYKVTCASEGEQGLVLAREQLFDLAVCDIMMPGMDGIEVLKRLKEFSPTTEVVMATGYATMATAIETLKSGAFDYISKPYSLSHLCAIFAKADERRRLKAKVNYLEELDRLKSEFVATVSHELRTPLASTMGYIALLRQGVYGAINEQQQTALERAALNSTHLLQLINGVLDLSKLQASGMTLFPEAFRLDELVTEVVTTMEPIITVKNLFLKVQCPQEIILHADRGKFKQVLTNIAWNAVKFTKTGGITIRVEVLADQARAIHIIDTGIGISPADLPKLFQEFRQVNGSSTREFGGAGLGLAISKRLIELMGGTISVQSTAGQGSEFTILLRQSP